MLKHYRFDSRGVLFVDGKVASTLSDEEHGIMLAALSMRAEVHSIGYNAGAAAYRETLRDKFAMAITQGVDYQHQVAEAADSGARTLEEAATLVARRVYVSADAMLAERGERGERRGVLTPVMFATVLNALINLRESADIDGERKAAAGIRKLLESFGVTEG